MANIRNQKPEGIGISSILSTYEPATSKFFTLTVNEEDLKNLVNANYNYKDNPTTNDYILNNDSETTQKRLLVTCKKCTVPKCDINQIEVKRGNDTYKYPGMPTWNDLTCEFSDFIDSKVREILYAWKTQAYSYETKTGPTTPKDYKKQVTLSQYSSYNKLLGTWTVYGAWIKELSEPDLDVESDEARVITLTLAYDYATFTPEK